MSKKLKGTTIIELTDVETGRKRVYKKDNMVTNFVKNIYEKNPLGLSYRLPSAAQMLSGIMLFEDQINGDENKMFLDKAPKAWAGPDQSISSRGGRGNMILDATTFTSNSITMKWEWDTAHGNGTYSAICLGNPDACNAEVFGIAGLGTNIGSSGRPFLRLLEANEKIYNIDAKNGFVYTLNIIGSHSIKLRKYRKGIYKKHIWQEDSVAQSKQPAGTTNALLNGVQSDLISEYTLTTTTNLYKGYTTPTDYAAQNIAASYTYQNGLHVIICGGSTFDIINIDDSNIESGGVTAEEFNMNLSDILNSANDLRAVITSRGGGGDNTRYLQSFSFLNNNSFLYKDGYIYFDCFTTNSNGVKILKVKYNDISDYKIINEGSLTAGANLEMCNSGLYIGNMLYKFSGNSRYLQTDGSNKVSYILNTDTDEVISYKNDSFTYLFNEHLTNCPYFSAIDDYYLIQLNAITNIGFYLHTNPLYLGTINNVDTFSKTASETMSITYTITEIDD